MRSQRKHGIQKFAFFGKIAFGKQENICEFSLRLRDLFAWRERKVGLFVVSKQRRNSRKNSNNWYNTKCLFSKLLIVTRECCFAVGDGEQRTVVTVIDTVECNEIMSVTWSRTSASLDCKKIDDFLTYFRCIAVRFRLDRLEEVSSNDHRNSMIWNSFV